MDLWLRGSQHKLKCGARILHKMPKDKHPDSTTWRSGPELQMMSWAMLMARGLMAYALGLASKLLDRASYAAISTGHISQP